MEFKDFQSGRKGLALVEKERDATQVAISNGLRGAVRGFLVKRDRVFLFSVIRYYKKILSVNCE